MNTTGMAKRCASFVIVSALFGCAASSNSGASLTPLLASAPQSATAGTQRSSGPKFRVFTAGTSSGLPISAVPRDIVPGPGGAIWFTDINTPAIGKISSGSTITEYTTGLLAGSQPYSMVEGPDGNMWFSDGAGAVGRITPSGTIAEFTSAHMRQAAPGGIAAGADNAIWTIGVGSRSYLFRVTLKGDISRSVLPSTLIPDGALAADAKGNLWFFASLANRSVVLVQRSSDGKLTQHATGLVTKGEPCCPNIAPRHIAIGPDGNPWFTTPYFGLSSSYFQLVGTLADGKAKFFDAARGGLTYPVYPSGITRSGSFLWYSGSDPLSFNGAIWRMDDTGRQAVYPIAYDPAGLTATSATTLWFTAQAPGEAPQIIEASF